MVICLEQARCRLFAYGLADVTASRTPSSLARLVLPFWFRLTQLVLETRPLNGCVSMVTAASPSIMDSRWGVLLALINVLCERAVYDLRMTSCPTSRVADVTAVDPSSLGYVSNTLGVARGPCGRSSCPWLVRGVPGQRVELSLVVLGHLRYHGNCASVIVAEPTDMYYVHIYLLCLLYLAYLLSHFYIKFLLP